MAAETVKIAGFRPGHVPLKMIAQQYGPQIRSDVIGDALEGFEGVLTGLPTYRGITPMLPPLENNDAN